MTTRTSDLDYPLLCFTRDVGIHVVQRASDITRCKAHVYWLYRFFDNLRVIDANGRTHEIARAELRKPTTRFGRQLARVFNLAVSVESEAVRAAPMTMADIKQVIGPAIEGDDTSLEDYTGQSFDWWKRSLAECTSVAELMRKLKEVSLAELQGGGHGGRFAWYPRLRTRASARRFRMTKAARICIVAALAGFSGLAAVRLYAPHVVVDQKLGGNLSAICAGLFTLFLALWADLNRGRQSLGHVVAVWTWLALWFLVDLVLALGNFSFQDALVSSVIASAILYWLCWFWIVSTTRSASRRQAM